MKRQSPGQATRFGQVTRAASQPHSAGRAADSSIDLDAPVQYVPGVGPARAELFARLGVEKVRDLLWHLPRRYEDRRQFKPIRLLTHGASETITGRVTGARSERRRGLLITTVVLVDASGSAQLTWFNQRFMEKRFPVGTQLVAHGKVERRYGAVQITNPECEVIAEGDPVNVGRVVPVYPLTEGLSQPVVRKAVFGLLPRLRPIPESLPEAVRGQHRLVALSTALRDIHFPESWEARDAALRRLVFEEFFRLQLRLAARKSVEEKRQGVSFRFTEAIAEEMRAMLPFALTAAQERVVGEIATDMQAPRPMHRLLQGDVGSGKTAVAAAAALIAIRNGYQVAVMAPTEILAEQHALTLGRLLTARGIAVDLLTGSMTEKEREAARQRLLSGETSLAVGTHALIQEDVAFSRLGLVIVDEQHRFGVMQRQSLWEKGVPGVMPDLLVMTATPIPRTLAMTLYGDLDLSVIDQLPPGRQPVHTTWISSEERDLVLERVREQLSEGRQVYYVCPLIEESDTLYAQSAVEKAAELSQLLSEYRVGLLHGRMKTTERAAVMEAFRAGELDVLTCTTVIEVGVDVPNATVIVIEDADRFGLAQLHQLRGRVGRGSHQSQCLLVTDPKHNPWAMATLDGQGLSDGQRRAKVMVETSDGFQIAEEDLQIRGPGDLYGTRQHGFDALGSLHVANVLRDSKELEEARAAAFAILAADPDLQRPEHAGLRQALTETPRGGAMAAG